MVGTALNRRSWTYIYMSRVIVELKGNADLFVGLVGVNYVVD
jgi:hypothetical protein